MTIEKEKKKISLVIHRISAGGAEKIMATIANYLSENGWKVFLLTFDDGKIAPFYPLNKNIKWIPLNLLKETEGKLQKGYHLFRRIWILRKTLKSLKAKVAISFIAKVNILSIIATLGTSVKVIVSERIDPKHSFFGYGSRIRYLKFWAYNKAARIIVLSKEMAHDFPPYIARKITVIPNPVSLKNLSILKSNGSPNGRKVIAMGRLHPQKGFDTLIEAFSKLDSNYSDWKLCIWGQGDHKENLIQLRDSLGLKDRVAFPGVTNQPLDEMKKSDLFVLSSRFEGFPNVLVEAMAVGLPVLSFNCVSTIKDIIQNGENGVIVDKKDSEGLSTAMMEIMADESKRKSLGNKAKDVLNKFSMDKVMSKWEKVIEDSMN